MAEGWNRGLIKGEGIPPPTGEFTVGCTDLLVELKEDKTPGGLHLRLYYPTKPLSTGYSYAAWFTNKRYLHGIMQFGNFKHIGLMSTLVNILSDPRIPALQNAPLLTEHTVEGNTSPARSCTTFPVVIFSHGQVGFRSMSSAICCDLASHGYIAAAMDHRDGSAGAFLRRLPKTGGRSRDELEDIWTTFTTLPEGEEQIYQAILKRRKEQVEDVMLTLDFLHSLNDGYPVKDLLVSKYNFLQFKNRLDLSRVALMGHSSGGGTTVNTLMEDPRFKCGMALDGSMRNVARNIEEARQLVLNQPFYFLNCTHQYQTKENVAKMFPLCTPPNEAGISTNRVITIKNSSHLAPTDLQFVAPKFLHPKSDEPLISQIDAHKLIMDICHSFLKRFLLKDPSFEDPVPNLDGGNGHSPHIIFGTNFELDETNRSLSGNDQAHIEESHSVSSDNNMDNVGQGNVNKL